MRRPNKKMLLSLLSIALFLGGLFTKQIMMGTVLAIVVGFLALAQKE